MGATAPGSGVPIIYIDNGGKTVKCKGKRLQKIKANHLREGQSIAPFP